MITTLVMHSPLSLQNIFCQNLSALKYRAFILLTLFVLSASGVSASGSEFDIERIHTILDTRSWHYGYDHATRLTSATLGTLSPSSTSELETILAQHRWQYDPGDNRIATQKDSQGRIPSTFNHLNQLLTQGSGPTRIAGIIDEPGTVTINGEEAKMRNETEFEAYLNLPAGLHQIDIEATDFSDFSDNTATQSYEITIANEPEEHFEYDLNGNLVERSGPNGTATYDWDAFARLIAIHHPDGTSSHFTYDGMSRRVAITEKDDQNTITQERKFLWEGLTIAEERSGPTGATIEKRFYPNGVELATGPNAGTYTYRTDHLGSIREVVGASSSLIARWDYDAWGVPMLVSGTFDLDFKYTGHFYHAPSTLHLAPFRAYDAVLGRWISRDPISEFGGINLYAYVEGNPLNLFDPDGLASISDHWQALRTWTLDEFKESLGLGAMATADGFIPFSDPFRDFGGYTGCEDGVGFSKAAGAVSRDAAILATGLPLAGSKRFITPGAAKGSNAARLVFSRITRNAKIGIRVPTPVGVPFTNSFTWRKTNSLAGVAGRYWPYFGGTLALISDAMDLASTKDCP